VVDGDAIAVGCYDYATDALCAGFPSPKAWSSSAVSGIYSVTQDPTYPSCLWVNADGGSAQIQNFDYRTGGVCGEGGSLLPVDDFIDSHPACQVTQWTKFQLVSPATGDYTSGTVEFDDSAGEPLPDIAVQDIGADGSIDLSSLGLESATDFANLRVRLVGATVPAIDVTLTWKAEWHPDCIAQGQTALTTTTTTEATTSTTAAPTTEGPTTIAEAQLPYTGSSSAALIIGGLGMLAVGAGAVLLAQRRQKLT
jgi:LPXTG-motif cell wall-anchored protein